MILLIHEEVQINRNSSIASAVFLLSGLNQSLRRPTIESIALPETLRKYRIASYLTCFKLFTSKTTFIKRMTNLKKKIYWYANQTTELVY